MNKKGSKLLTMYWFLMLLIIAGGVTIMVFLFYGNPYDVRGLETNILLNRVADCASPDGYLNENFFEEGKFKEEVEELGYFCDLDLSTEKIWETPQYFIKIEIFDFDSEEVLFSGEEGNTEDAAFCNVNLEEEKETLARCFQKEFYSLDREGNKYRVKILAVVRKTEKNAA